MLVRRHSLPPALVRHERGLAIRRGRHVYLHLRRHLLELTKRMCPYLTHRKYFGLICDQIVVAFNQLEVARLLIQYGITSLDLWVLVGLCIPDSYECG
jgi:hypothetical protein